MSLTGAAGRVGSASLPDAGSFDPRFPGSCRLKARRQFLAVYASGYRVRARFFTLFGLPNNQSDSRLGVTATKKVGNAVVRNRIKRRLRELFRHHRIELQPGFDLVVNAYRDVATCEYRQLESEFLASFRRLSRRIQR